jgi:hypothetical protein
MTIMTVVLPPQPLHKLAHLPSIILLVPFHHTFRSTQVSLCSTAVFPLVRSRQRGMLRVVSIPGLSQWVRIATKSPARPSTNLVFRWTSTRHVLSRGPEERRLDCAPSVLNQKNAVARTRSYGFLPNSPLSSGEYSAIVHGDSSHSSRRVLLSSRPIHPVDGVPLASYHMQYSHGSFMHSQRDIRKFTRIPGISAFSAAPFSPPMIFRTKPRNQVTKHERSQITEGKCHKCSKWIPLETIKDADVKVRFICIIVIENSTVFRTGQGDLLVSISLHSSADTPSLSFSTTGGSMPLLVTTDPRSKGNATSLLRITFIRKLYEAANLDTGLVCTCTPLSKEFVAIM